MSSRDVYLHPFSEELLSESVHVGEMYDAFLREENVRPIPISTSSLYKEILNNKKKGRIYFLNWLDPIYSHLHLFPNIGRRGLREFISLLLFPVLFWRFIKLYLGLKKFLLENKVYFFCHDSSTFSRSPIYRFVDWICRPLILRLSKCVFFAELSCQNEIEKIYGLTLKSTEIVRLGPFAVGRKIKTKAELRKEFSVPEDAIVLIFAGTVRGSHRDLSYETERKILDEGMILIRAGRGHYRRFQDSSCRVFSGFVEAEALEALVKLADYSLIPSRRYLTSAVARLSIELEVPVIAPSFGSIKDMCAECFLDYREFELSENISDFLHLPGSLEYKRMVKACKLRSRERDWQKECAKIVKRLV